MSKIKINSIKNAEFLDLTTPYEGKKQKKSTVTNKACIFLSVWGLILSVLGSGVTFAIASFAVVLVNRVHKNLKTSSAKWAFYLSITSLFVNVVMIILLAL